MTTTLDRALTDLQAFYTELPGVECQACGFCCVSPGCTLVEFIHLVRWAQQHLDAEAFRQFIHRPPQLHPDHPGDTRCAFIVDARCSVHNGRTGACRIFGVPSLSELHIEDLEECRNSIAAVGRADAEFMRGWIQRLALLDQRLFAVGSEPYFVRGFNVECWLDIYFDESLSFDVFADIRKVMLDAVDLSAYRSEYRDKTNLREKIDKISVLSTMMGMVDAETMRNLLESIRDGYPFTGTHFLHEAQEYLRVLDEGCGSPA
jgi:Fe-S-cluster containining protein